MLNRLLTASGHRARWCWIFVLFLIFTGSAWASSITIGSIQYLGMTAQGQGVFKVILNTNGVTASSITISNVTLAFDGMTQSSGRIMTPTTLLFIIGAGGQRTQFARNGALLQLNFGTGKEPLTLTLANGQKFTTRGAHLTFLMPAPGQRALRIGQSVPITLTSVPEPTSLWLVGTGVAAMALAYAKRPKK